LGSRQATGHGRLDMRHQFLGIRKNSPQPRCLVPRRGDDARAVGAKRRASDVLRMACERVADRLAGLRVPQPRRLVRRRGDDALAVGAKRRALTSCAWPVSGSPIGLPVSASEAAAAH
jgi:hypothetical protein